MTTGLNEKLTKEYLCYKFTEAEMMAFGKSLARASQEFESMEERKKQITKDLASQLETKRGEILLYSRFMNNGHEWRDIECRVIFDSPETGYKTIWRTDTGEMVSTARMTPEERQLKFKFDEANKPADEPENPAPPMETAVLEEVPEVPQEGAQDAPQQPEEAKVEEDAQTIASASQMAPRAKRDRKPRNPEAEHKAQLEAGKSAGEPEAEYQEPAE